MNTVFALILVCAASTAQPDCTRDTALDVRSLPVSAVPFACLMGGMSTLAREGGTQVGTYGKILCERRRG